MEPQQPTNFKSTLLTQEERANFYPVSSDLKQPERRSWVAFPLQFLDSLSHGKQQWRTNGCRQGDPAFHSTGLPLWASWGQFWKNRQAEASKSTPAWRHLPDESTISLRCREVNCQHSLTKNRGWQGNHIFSTHLRGNLFWAQERPNIDTWTNTCHRTSYTIKPSWSSVHTNHYTKFFKLVLDYRPGGVHICLKI